MMDSSVDISPSELDSPFKGAGGEGEHATNKEFLQVAEHTYVQDMVNQNKIVVFSKTHCPHCTDSKTLLSGKGVEYKTVELDQMNNGCQVQNVLENITSARTVPRIFIDGQCVGGNSDLKTLDKTGKLEDLLKKVKG